MAVLHASKSGDSVYYRFIDQPFDLDRFVDEQGELVDGSDLNRHITKRNEFCSEQITALADYRAIIQNTVRKKEHRALAGRFAFVGAGSRLAHIEKIVTGMFSREISFHDIRRVIASCITEDNQSIRLMSNKTEMESWLKEYRAYQSIMSHSGRMKALGESALRHEEASLQLCGIHTEFLLLLRQHERSLQEVGLLLNDIDREISLLADESNKRLRVINEELGRAEGHHKNINDQITGLENRRDLYAQEKIEDLASLVDQIPEMETTAVDLKARETALLGESSSLATQYAGMQNARTARFHDLERQQNLLKDPIRTEEEAALDQITRQSKARWGEIEAAYEKQEQGLLNEKSSISEKLGALRVAVNSPQPAQKYVDALDAAQNSLTAAMESQSQSLQAYETAERECAQEVREFENIDSKIQAIHRQGEKESAKRDQLLSLANAEPGTLLHFLRENRPEWVNDIARVVPEQLLLRKDLDPSITKGEDLYGVSLDLFVIDTPRAADEEVLRGQIEAVNRAIAQAQEELKAQNAELAIQSDRLNDANIKTAEMKRLWVQAGSHKDVCEMALLAARRELEANRNEAKRNAQRDFSEQQVALTKNNEALVILKAGRTEKRQAHEVELARALKAVKDTAKEALGRIDDSIRLARSECDSDLTSLKTELEQALKTAGVDTASLDRLQDDKDKLNARLVQARKGIATVGGWRNWIKDEWSRREQLKIDLVEADKEVKRLAREEIQVKTSRDTQNKVLIGRHVQRIRKTT